MIAKRLYSIDALRGVGAIAIILWHWQHFWAVRGTWQAVWSRADEPFYWAFKPLYDQGWAAVDIFFAVSGFVFFWLYLEPVAKREIGMGKFALQRVSRLYPLYVVTLLAATAMQFAFRDRTGNFFIFDANDWQHFVKSLFLVQNWLPPDEMQSFNGPAWAVSIEVLLYVIFFAAVRFGLRGPLGAIGFAIAGAIIFFWDGQIGRGIMGFFWGGVTYYVVRALVSHPRAKGIATFVIAAAIAAWILCVVEVYLGPIQALFAAVPFAKFLIAHEYAIFLQTWIFIVVPLSIVALALHEQLYRAPYERLTLLGDISYSTYMVHFPMQLALALLALSFGWMPADFMHGRVMVAFYGVLILLGWISYTYFERPLSAFLRKKGDLAQRSRWIRGGRGDESAREARQ